MAYLLAHIGVDGGVVVGVVRIGKWIVGLQAGDVNQYLLSFLLQPRFLLCYERFC